MEDSKYIFRKLEKEDYYKNYFSLLRQLTSLNDDRIKYNQFCNFIDKLNEDHQIWLIENKENKKIVGTGTILIENKIIHDMGRVGHIEDIVIDSETRGGGLGKLMINYLIEIAIKNECYKVILDCGEYNKIFYEKCGLEKKGIEMVKYIK